jgi:hypothetical protein
VPTFTHFEAHVIALLIVLGIGMVLILANLYAKRD